MSYQEKRKKYRSWPYIYIRSKDWLLDPMLVWTIGDHRCTGLIKCILFDYSYASFGVRIAKQLALQFFNIYCYSARGNSIGSIFFSSLSEPSPGHGISLGHRLSSEPRGRREEDEKEREEEEEKEREERKEEKLGYATVPLQKLLGLPFLFSFSPNSNLFLAIHGGVVMCGAARRQATGCCDHRC